MDDTRIITGHQPVYLPWLGLIHKASLADIFIYMDDVQYLTNDWNNRNRIKVAGNKVIWLTVPVSLKLSKSTKLCDILIDLSNYNSKKNWQVKHWRTLQLAYGKAPFFKDYAPFFEWLYLENRWDKLSDLNLVILRQVFEWFKIDARIIIASGENFSKKKSELLLEHCLRYGANILITGTLGRNYVKVEDFHLHGIKVYFQDYIHPTYTQRFRAFISDLSFVDLLFNEGPRSREICLQGNIKREELCNMLLNQKKE